MNVKKNGEKKIRKNICNITENIKKNIENEKNRRKSIKLHEFFSEAYFFLFYNLKKIIFLFIRGDGKSYHVKPNSFPPLLLRGVVHFLRDTLNVVFLKKFNF